MASLSADREKWRPEDPDEDFYAPKSYSPFKFYTVSRDRKSSGGASVRVRVPESIYREMRKIYDSRRFPKYETIADMIRDAIVHRVHFLQHEFLETPENTDLQRLLSLRENMSYENTILEEVERTLEVLKSSIAGALKVGEEDKARGLLREAVRNMPTDPVARKHYARGLLQHFRAWMLEMFPNEVAELGLSDVEAKDETAGRGGGEGG